MLANLSQIAGAKSTGHAWEALARLGRDLGYDYTGVGLIGTFAGDVSIALDHATPFFRRSFKEYHNNDLHLSDPAAHLIAQGASLTFARTAILTAPRHLRSGARKMAAHLKKDDVTGHATLRIDMPGQSFASFFAVGERDRSGDDSFTERVDAQRDLLNLAATAYTSVALRQLGRPNPDILTAREAHVLTLLARGLSPQEIAEDEGRSLTTIRHQILSARRRLGARNTANAVAIALQLGAIRI